jgi:hypothetical protein
MTSSNMELPPALEQLGALGSLLIHDMANQMCIISGNATFAQMSLSDPQAVRRAVEAITKASERVSFILGQCSDVRRRLSSELPRGQGREALAGWQAAFAARPGWTLDLEGQFDGELTIPTDWVVFGLQQVLEEIKAETGQARIRRVRSKVDTAFLPGGTYLQLRLTWEAPTPFSMDEVRARYQNHGLMASFELIRQCGGKLDGFTPAANHQEVLLCVPYVFEFPPKP